MIEERIHQHDWENGRCKVCGINQQQAPDELSDAPMSKRELAERLDRIERRVAGAENFTNLVLAALAVMLLILLLRGC